MCFRIYCNFLCFSKFKKLDEITFLEVHENFSNMGFSVENVVIRLSERTLNEDLESKIFKKLP